jgi:hypothetical protein
MGMISGAFMIADVTGDARVELLNADVPEPHRPRLEIWANVGRNPYPGTSAIINTRDSNQSAKIFNHKVY